MLGTCVVAAAGRAVEGDVPQSGFGKLDHAFLITLENDTDADILGDPNAPFINAYAKIANQATNYFAVGHPSAPNYLEIVGGSNFGLKSDYWPNRPGKGCIDNDPKSAGCACAFAPIADPSSKSAGRDRDERQPMQPRGRRPRARRLQTIARRAIILQRPSRRNPSPIRSSRSAKVGRRTNRAYRRLRPVSSA